MATKVYEVEDVELQDGKVLTFKPLNVFALRKFMEEIDKLGGVEKESEALEITVNAAYIAVQEADAEYAEDREQVEKALDLPTIWKILEVAGGIKLDPNQMAAAGLSGLTST